MRVRLTELLKSSGLTIYAVARATNGRVSTTQLYRLRKNGGRVRYLDSRMLDALCDVFGIGPSELLEHERPKRR